MTDEELDKRIADTMRAYFDLKRVMALLKRTLEHARKEAGQTIEVFYDPGRNVAYASEIVRLHHGRRDMSKLLSRVEELARGERSRTVATPSAENDIPLEPAPG